MQPVMGLIQAFAIKRCSENRKQASMADRGFDLCYPILGTSMTVAGDGGNQIQGACFKALVIPCRKDFFDAWDQGQTCHARQRNVLT